MSKTAHRDFAARKAIFFKNLDGKTVDYALVLQKAAIPDPLQRKGTDPAMCYCNDCITSRLQARGYDYLDDEWTSSGEIAHPVEYEDVVSMLAGIDDTTRSMLPPGTVWNSYDHRSLIVEEEGTTRTIQYMNPGNGRSHWFTLQLPKLLYGISPKGDAPYVSHVWLTSEGGYKALPLPNIFFSTGAVCTHDVSASRTTESYHDMITSAIADFWGAGFNEEVGDFKASPFVHYLAAEVGNTQDKLLQQAVDKDVSNLRRVKPTDNMGLRMRRSDSAEQIVTFMNAQLWGNTPTLKVLKLWETDPVMATSAEHLEHLITIGAETLISELEKINTETAQGANNTQRLFAKINSSVAVAKQNHT